MAIIDADVLLSIWLEEKTCMACIEALSALQDEPLLISDFNALEVLLRSKSVLEQSFEEGLASIERAATIVTLSKEELILVCKLRSGTTSLTLGDAYAAALALSRRQKLISTDRRFAAIEALKPWLHLVKAKSNH